MAQGIIIGRRMLETNIHIKPILESEHDEYGFKTTNTIRYNMRDMMMYNTNISRIKLTYIGNNCDTIYFTKETFDLAYNLSMRLLINANINREMLNNYQRIFDKINARYNYETKTNNNIA